MNSEEFARFTILYGCGAIDTLGIVGNILLLVLLVRQRRQAPMYQILKVVCVVDLISLLVNFASQVFTSMDSAVAQSWTKTIYRFSMSIIWPFVMTTHLIKVWLTVLLSIERWFAVCRPLHLRSGFTFKRTRLLIMMIILLAILFSLPRCFEMECLPRVVGDTGQLEAEFNGSDVSDTNATGNVEEVAASEWPPCEWLPTPIASSKLYAYIYGVAAYALVFCLLPVGSVLLLNAHIILELRRWKASVRELSASQKLERRISGLPLGVAIMFCVLETPALVINVVQFAAPQNRSTTEVWSVVLALNQMLILADSALNFIIYILSAKNGRGVLSMCTGSLEKDSVSTRSKPFSNSIVAKTHTKEHSTLLTQSRA